MKAQRMLVRHAPAEGTYGDCFRVCVAAILNMDATDVPHVFSIGYDGDAAHAAMEKWLRARGLTLIWCAYEGSIPLQRILDEVEAQNPGIPFILGGESVPGVGHFVVGQGGKIACDPSPSDLGLCGPQGAWYVGFIGSALVFQSEAA